MTKPYEVWFRDPLKIFEDQIGCADFDGDIDYAPYQEFGPDGKRRYKDMMGANFVFEQSDIIAEDPETHGATFVPVILGSDKTTVSVATGQNEYYPLYAGIGNIKNHVRRAHRNALSLIGFLAIPKADRKHQNSVEFRTFRRQLFHSSLARIFNSLKPWMTTLVSRAAPMDITDVSSTALARTSLTILSKHSLLVWCLAGVRNARHWQRILTMIKPQFHDLRNTPISYKKPSLMRSRSSGMDMELSRTSSLSPLISPGTFKDHLVLWVGEYLELVHGKSRANEILADIDRRIAAASISRPSPLPRRSWVQAMDR
ncbi:hypothetical protein LshimejAT787_0410000 [Lyophyllum shimeji]|uniref:Uncharacterized protein n=1 Tax=Lyophyllum shimeji TaxID=47721 RepID=A0A9P3PM42_LYOSH|nr:hypothetical protein LshimejAT787_0410000 [Lyophyllum shimeji]